MLDERTFIVASDRFPETMLGYVIDPYGSPEVTDPGRASGARDAATEATPSPSSSSNRAR